MPQERITLGKLLEKHIMPDSNVVCVGVYIDPDHDPSPLYASYLTRKGKGTVTMIDTQAEELKTKLESSIIRGTAKGVAKFKRVELLSKLNSAKASSGGAGDVLSHRRKLGELSKLAGLCLKRPKVLLADAMNSGLPVKHADVLLDMGTLAHIATGRRVSSFSPNWAVDKFMTELLSEYRRISKKSILAFESEDEPLYEPVSRLAAGLGGTVDYFPVANRCAIPAGKNFVLTHLNRWHDHNYTHALVIHWPDKQDGKEGETA
jgi:hypothetical protein